MVRVTTSVSGRKRLGAAGAMACLLASVATLTLSACGSSATAGNDSKAGTAMACPDDGDRLPVTGLCASRSLAYLNTPGGDTGDVPEGCEWVVQETPFDDQVLLYRAMKCEGRTTKLAYKPGKPMGELSYDVYGYGDAEGSMKGTVAVRIATGDDRNPAGPIMKIVSPTLKTAAERAKCKVRKAGIEGWPKDTLIVDDLDEVQSNAVAGDGPRVACGPMGVNQDEASYWRAFQSRVWFFQLGQDIVPFDPGSLTLLAKDANGQWSQAQ